MIPVAGPIIDAVVATAPWLTEEDRYAAQSCIATIMDDHALNLERTVAEIVENHPVTVTGACSAVEYMRRATTLRALSSLASLSNVSRVYMVRGSLVAGGPPDYQYSGRVTLSDEGQRGTLQDAIDKYPKFCWGIYQSDDGKAWTKADGW